MDVLISLGMEHSLVLAAISLGAIWGITKAAIGLGLVIFFHELGHFAVAKWCNVQVERFSIGFGPILLSKQWGETEYALSVIPFGGYVKMLGQDDADPGQMVDAQIAENPRSYVAKTVPQRMAIISAGVTMNVITGILFFAFAFWLGVWSSPSTAGNVQIGLPAWQSGMRVGDRITSINGRVVESYGDIIRHTALSSSTDLDVNGVSANGTPFSRRVVAAWNETRYRIGVEPTVGLVLPAGVPDFCVPRSAASKAEPPLTGGDIILGVSGVPISTYADLQTQFNLRIDEEVVLTVRKADDPNAPTREVKIPPNPFVSLGIELEMGPVVALQKDGPAAKAGMQTEHKIIRVNDENVGETVNAIRLSEWFSAHAGEEVSVTVVREVEGSGREEKVLKLIPDARPAWAEYPTQKNEPLSIPSIGAAYHLLPAVRQVRSGGPADGKIQVGDRILSFELFLPEGATDSAKAEPSLRFDLQDDKNRNWACAFWRMQLLRERHVRLLVKRVNIPEPQTVELIPAVMPDWNAPMRGFGLEPLREIRRAATFGEAVTMGLRHTRDSALDIYLTLRNLIAQRLSYQELHGPIGIAKVAYRSASMGYADLLLFLGFLSINLAVINFLPIPVLDGGHMVFLIWEGVTRRKPSETVVIVATYIGLAFILGLMATVLYLDLFHHKLLTGGP